MGPDFHGYLPIRFFHGVTSDDDLALASALVRMLELKDQGLALGSHHRADGGLN